MTKVNEYLSAVSKAKSDGDVHAVNWLTGCFMPFSESIRSAAKNGLAVSQREPSAKKEMPMEPVGPIVPGKIVFHSSVRRPATVEAPMEVVDAVMDSSQES